MEIRGNDTPLEPLFLLPLNIGEFSVVEDNHHHLQSILHGSSKFLKVVKKTTIAGNGNHLPIRMCRLDSKGSRITVSQRTLVASGNEMSWMICWKRIPGGKPDLSDFIHEKTVIGQFLPDDLQELILRFDLLSKSLLKF